MLKKRIVGVINVAEGKAVQTLKFSNKRVTGDPLIVLENLDRWGTDEILIQVIDRSKYDLGPDFDLIQKMKSLQIGTPLIYAGGVRTAKEGAKIIKEGFDRLAINSMLFNKENELQKLSYIIGAQGIIASLPLKLIKDDVVVFDYILKKNIHLTKTIKRLLVTDIISEILILDVDNDGGKNSFNPKLIYKFPVQGLKLIPFGGISDVSQMSSLLKFSEVSGLGLGNVLYHKEHQLQKIKEYSNNKRYLRIAEYRK